VKNKNIPDYLKLVDEEYVDEMIEKTKITKTNNIIMFLKEKDISAGSAALILASLLCLLSFVILSFIVLAQA
jgi:hypothetical protein